MQRSILQNSRKRNLPTAVPIKREFGLNDRPHCDGQSRRQLNDDTLFIDKKGLN
ncbi:hypothetical protein KIN20_019587 [Parelaphostrongylus tenuis]|uniref:Uncharacterized protein n=1 Tax=Parelaphostrongylus tenuis TaxID=148309 RepID=A0AAD5MRS4_PARTN|nr:hypothetical protein KIN20_019587 [Parelaphostrongylus tenuis]